MILVSVEKLPDTARTDPAARDLAIAGIVVGQQASLKMENAKLVDKPQSVTDARFLRKSRSRYDVQGTRIDVVLRIIVVNDQVVSVTSIAQGDVIDAVEKTGDDVAAQIKPAGK